MEGRSITPQTPPEDVEKRGLAGAIRSEEPDARPREKVKRVQLKQELAAGDPQGPRAQERGHSVRKKAVLCPDGDGNNSEEQSG
jgi:hypothetical protein